MRVFGRNGRTDCLGSLLELGMVIDTGMLHLGGELTDPNRMAQLAPPVPFGGAGGQIGLALLERHLRVGGPKLNQHSVCRLL